VVEGARAFASFSRAQAEAMKIEEEMPQLRQLAPAEFQRVMSQRLTAVSEGDAGTDVLIQQAFVQEMPRILRNHTKEHLGWQQQQYAEQARSAMSIAATRFRSHRQRYNPNAGPEDILNHNFEQGSFLDENDMLEAKIAFVETFQPVPGVPAETHQRLTTSVVSNLLAQQDLHAFYTLEDAGVIDDLGPDNAKRLRDYADRIESRARANMPTALVNRLAAIRAMPQLYDADGINEELMRAVDGLNADFQAATGAREPLLSGSTSADLLASLYRNQLANERRLNEADARSRDQRATATERENADEVARNSAVTSLLMGQPANLPRQRRDEAWDYLRGQAPGPDGLPPVFVARVQSYRSHTDELGQDSIRSEAAKVVASGDPLALERLYQTEYLPMVLAAGNREHVAMSYFGDYANHFSAYHAQRQHAGNDESRIIAAGVNALSNHRPLAAAKDSDDQLGMEAVREHFDRWGPFTGSRLAPHMQEEFWRTIRGEVSKLRGGATSQNIQAVEARLAREGLEYAGGMFWQSNEPQQMAKAVTNLIGTQNNQQFSQQDDAPRWIAETFTRVAEEQGLQKDTLRPIFNPRSRPGAPEIYLMGTDRDGAWRVVSIKPADVLASYTAGKSRQAERARWGGAENPVKREFKVPNILPGLTGPAALPSRWPSGG
jgi:hypothetical protein